MSIWEKYSTGPSSAKTESRNAEMDHSGTLERPLGPTDTGDVFWSSPASYSGTLKRPRKKSRAKNALICAGMLQPHAVTIPSCTPPFARVLGKEDRVVGGAVVGFEDVYRRGGSGNGERTGTRAIYEARLSSGDYGRAGSEVEEARHATRPWTRVDTAIIMKPHSVGRDVDLGNRCQDVSKNEAEGQGVQTWMREVERAALEPGRSRNEYTTIHDESSARTSLRVPVHGSPVERGRQTPLKLRATRVEGRLRIEFPAAVRVGRARLCHISARERASCAEAHGLVTMQQVWAWILATRRGNRRR
ncbi:hypothetical protein FB451DRAFT_1176927 [Mycena latifolia]|nr:hypothetical protein FB451DRAFT_1176927 [Mycena latifolia]